MVMHPWFATVALLAGTTQLANVSAAQLEQRGWQAYEMGSFGTAIELWQQSAQSYLRNYDTLGQARVMGSIALTQQQQGNWEEATSAIETSHSLLKVATQSQDPANPSVLQEARAKILEIEARLHQALGQTQQALASWQTAATLYQALNNKTAQWRCQLFQIQAEQRLGQHTAVLGQLMALEAQMDLELQQAQTQPPAFTQLRGQIQRQQAIAHWHLQNPNQAQRLLKQALNTLSQHPSEQAKTWLLLGHLAQGQNQYPAASRAFRKASQEPSSHSQALQALIHLHLQELSLEPSSAKESDAKAKGRTRLINLWQQLQQAWKQSSPNLAQLQSRLGLIQHFTRVAFTAEELPVLEALVYESIQQAYGLGEAVAIAEATATLAQVRHAAQNNDSALALLQEAESKALSSPMLRYRLSSQQSQMQLGQIQLAKLSPPPVQLTNLRTTLRDTQEQLQALQEESPGVRPVELEQFKDFYDQLTQALDQPQPDMAALQAIAEQLQNAELLWQLQTHTWLNAAFP